MLPYNSYSAYLKKRFGGPVRKIAVDAGFSCPNRDGTVGHGGCIYCNNASFSPGHKGGIREQIEASRALMARRNGADKLIAYFQSFTNTHAPLPVLQQYYREALACPGIIGLAIGTRPDCLGEPVLDLLQSLSRETYILLEIGLQSSHDATLGRINRGHTYGQFVEAVERASTRGLEICAHIILGLPGEGWEEMNRSAAALSSLPVQGVKLHCLHVCRNTALEREFANGHIALLTQEEYVQYACDFLERLRPDIRIHRLAAQAPADVLIAPLWLRDKAGTHTAICRELLRRRRA